MNTVLIWDTINAVHATGAYGRKYDTLEDILIDWHDGLDFKIRGGSYFSIRDAEVLRNDGYDFLDVDGWIIPLK